jgi:pimeloyl-ACP methyl ester carboxylesterase
VRRYRFLPLAPGVSESLRHAIAEHSVREEPDGRFGFKFDPRWFSQQLGPPIPFSNIRCRCLILRGQSSPLLSPEGAEEIASEISSSEIIEIPDSGHNAHLERPDAVLHAIRQHLDPER